MKRPKIGSRKQKDVAHRSRRRRIPDGDIDRLEAALVTIISEKDGIGECIQDSFQCFINYIVTVLDGIRNEKTSSPRQFFTKENTMPESTYHIPASLITYFKKRLSEIVNDVDDEGKFWSSPEWQEISQGMEKKILQDMGLTRENFDLTDDALSRKLDFIKKPYFKKCITQLIQFIQTGSSYCFYKIYADDELTKILDSVDDKPGEIEDEENDLDALLADCEKENA
jgi:hypothetical protein